MAAERILLKNCYHLVTDAEDPGRGGVDVLIEGNRIAAIGTGLADAAGAGAGGAIPPGATATAGAAAATAGASGAPETRVIDASRHVVVPGFVNTHHHFYQTLTR
ncbi:MAG: hypothetical protein R6W94_02180, partial [Spirochaetia bacterium]